MASYDASSSYSNSMHSSSGFGAFLASFKLSIKKSKQELSDILPSNSPLLRRQKLSLDLTAIQTTTYFEEFYGTEFQCQNQQFQSNEQESSNNNKRRLGSSLKLRQKISKKHSLSLNEEIDDSLHNAVMVGSVELTRQILQDKKLDINVLKPPGWTALHLACRMGNVELIKLLVDTGANTTQVNVDGHSPLRISVIYGNFDAAYFLIHECQVGSEDIINGFQTENDYKINRNNSVDEPQ